MRTLTLKTNLVLCGLLAAFPAFAQQGEPKPDDVQLQPEGEAPAPAPGAEEPAPAPPGDTTAPAPAATDPATAAAAPGAPVDTPPAAPPEATGQEDQAGPAPSHGGPGSYGGPVTEEGDVWKFTYSGYFRAPMRLGIGKRAPASTLTGDQEQSSTTLHVPIVPDDQYLSWQHTRHNQRDWAELFFTVGNSWASGTVAIQGFNFTDSAWSDPKAQFGVGQGFVTLTPELPWENVRLIWKVGNGWGRYGAAGRYDAGEFDTFLFGRTHAMGEILRLEMDVNEYTFFLEHGIGTKRPDPSVFNRSRFTMLHHAHVGLNWDKTLDIGLHYLTAWTQEEERDFGPFFQPLGQVPGGGYTPTQGGLRFRANATGAAEDPIPDGSLTVFGADLRADLGSFGYFYGGFSRVQAKYAFTVAPAIEVIHAFGGGEYSLGVVDTYLDPPTGRTNANRPCQNAAIWTSRSPEHGGMGQCSGGNGAINTISGQYEMSFGDIIAGVSDGGSPFPEGMDLSLKLYGMYNMVQSDNIIVDAVRGEMIYNEYNRLKFGTDVIFDLFPALSLAARFDRVQPNDHVSEQSFSILSPRLIFRTQFVTREQVELQYSRYMYAKRDCDAGDPLGCVQAAPSGTSPEGFGVQPGVQQDTNIRGTPSYSGNSGEWRPDVNVIKLQASMWW